MDAWFSSVEAKSVLDKVLHSFIIKVPRNWSRRAMITVKDLYDERTASITVNGET